MKKDQLLAAFNFATSWPWLLLIVALIAYMVVMIFMRKKSDSKVVELQNALKVGDKVVTNSGIYGEIVSMQETTVGKVAVIKTGEGKDISFITVHSSVIYGIDEKQEVVLDKDGNPIMPEVDKPQVEVKDEQPKTDEILDKIYNDAKKESEAPSKKGIKTSTKKSSVSISATAKKKVSDKK